MKIRKNRGIKGVARVVELNGGLGELIQKMR